MVASPDVGIAAEAEAEAEAEAGSSREAGVAALASSSRAVEGAGVVAVAAVPKRLPRLPLRLSRALQARALRHHDRLQQTCGFPTAPVFCASPFSVS